MPASMTWNRKQVAQQDWLDSPAPTPVPPQLKYCEQTTGPKLMEVTLDGAAGVGASQGRWILNGHFFYYSAAHVMPDGKPWSHIAISGMDPESGEYRLWEFNSDGDVAAASPGPNGLTITGEVTVLTGGTQAFSGKAREAGQTFLYEASITVDGNPVPYTWTWMDAPRPAK